MAELSKAKIEKAIWGFEKWVLIIMIGSILMLIADSCGRYISDFYPWDFVAGGVWIGYCNWRRKIKG